jgi:CHAD domain-containing protein
MKLLLSILFLFTVMPFKAHAQLWVENDLEEGSWYLLKSKEMIPDEISSLSRDKLKSAFESSQPSALCESTILENLIASYGQKNLIPALMQARRLDLIDDVVLDVLYPIASDLGKTEDQDASAFELKKGSEKLTTLYQNLFSTKGCALDRLTQILSAVKASSQELPQGILSYLNNWAYQQKIISSSQLILADTMARALERSPGDLRLNDYANKRQQVRAWSQIALKKGKISLQRQGKLSDLSKGLRYQLYASLSLGQMKSLAKVMSQLNKRIMSDKSEIIFIVNGKDTEKIELGPTEQLRLSLKLYQRERNILMMQDDLKGKPITYGHLLGLSFEIGKITTQDFDYLSSIPSLWDRKKTREEKLRNFVHKFGFIIPVLTGPVGGYAYMIAVSMLDTYVDNDIKKNNKLGDFSQDLFYGNCDVKGL